MKANIQGVTASLKQYNEQHYLAIQSTFPLHTLNSSIWGGGFGTHRCIVNRQVHKSYMCDHPREEMRAFLLNSGEEPEYTAGMLTAAYVSDVGFSAETLPLSNPFQEGQNSLNVSSWVTVGLGNAARAGRTHNMDSLYPGTINSIIVIDGTLSDSAMVNAVITATEAKTAALQDLQIKTKAEDAWATGTTTDAVVIAATQRGAEHAYAGTATKLGYLIGKTVYDAVKISTLALFGRGSQIK
jgi:adenosylcobinamide hydrolase